jgi:hypothetical protein
MAASKPVKIKQSIKFDDTMRRVISLPPPPSGKKAKQKVWRKKKR